MTLRTTSGSIPCGAEPIISRTASWHGTHRSIKTPERREHPQLVVMEVTVRHQDRGALRLDHQVCDVSAEAFCARLHKPFPREADLPADSARRPVMPHSARLPGQSGWRAVMAAGGSACARVPPLTWASSRGGRAVFAAAGSARSAGEGAPAPAGAMLSATGRQRKGTMQGDAASKGPAVPGTQEQ